MDETKFQRWSFVEAVKIEVNSTYFAALTAPEVSLQLAPRLADLYDSQTGCKSTDTITCQLRRTFVRVNAMHTSAILKKPLCNRTFFIAMSITVLLVLGFGMNHHLPAVLLSTLLFSCSYLVSPDKSER